MTDIELLKLAAKAVGYTLKFGEVYITGDTEVDCTDVPYVVSGEPDEADWYWNPLEDCGDAFRLAVALQLCIDMDRYMNEVSVEVDGCSYEECLRDTDPYRATRRAIVRAAAEIGKKKGNYE